MSAGANRSLIENLYATWYPILVRHCRRLLGDHARAEDCAQQALCELYNQLEAGHSIDNPRAWTLVVARRRAFHDQREAKILTQIDLGQIQVPDREAPPALDETSEDFPRMLAALTPREEAVILLRLESMKYREIAERLGVTPSTVNTLLARALEKLEHWRAQSRRPTSQATKEKANPRADRVQ
jgi:RNA polymerase sigma factor (sigma-70 family)